MQCFSHKLHKFKAVNVNVEVSAVFWQELLSFYLFLLVLDVFSAPVDFKYLSG
jgi:hypothetical protein